MDPTSKMIIVVDEDIDPKDPDMVMWAMSFAMQPHRMSSHYRPCRRCSILRLIR